MIAGILFWQHKRRLYTRTSPNSQYQNQIDYILCSQKRRSCIQSAKSRPRTDCGSDHQHLIEKFRLKLKKVRKTTRSARYNLNQIPYEYAVEVMNRIKGLDLVNRVPEELWTEVCNIVLEAVNKTIAKKKKRRQMVIWGGFTNGWRKRSEKQQRTGRIHPTKCWVPKKSTERQEGPLQWTVHKTRRKQQKEKD